MFILYISMDSVISTLTLKLLQGRRTLCGTDWAGAGRCLISDNFSRIYWPLSGEGFVEHHGRTFRLIPGRLYIIPSNSPGRYWCPRRMNLDWFHFTAEVLGGVELFDFYGCEYETAVPKPERVSVGRQWDRLLKCFSSGSTPDAAEAEALMRMLIVRFLRTADLAGQEMRLRAYERFAPAMKYIEENISAEIVIGKVAERVNLQENYFTNLFTANFGISPVRYINLQRVKRAQELLQKGRMPMKEVAAQCGFSNEFYFSKVFKKTAGISPAAFRDRKTVP